MLLLGDIMSFVTITVDGGASTGTTTQTEKLADYLTERGYPTKPIISGRLYRALTYIAADAGMTSDTIDVDALFALADEKRIDLVDGQICSLGVPIPLVLLETPEIERLVPFVAEIPRVRVTATNILRACRRIIQQHVIMDGRDAGTNIFPDATLKFFFKVDPLIAAERSKSVLEEILERDTRDMNRSASPLREPDGAFVIDTADPVELVFNRMKTILRHHVDDFSHLH